MKEPERKVHADCEGSLHVQTMTQHFQALLAAV